MSKISPTTSSRTFRHSLWGSVPSEWNIYPVDCLGEIVTGKTPSTSQQDYFGGEVPFISPADIGEQRYISQSQSTLTVKGAQQVRILPANAILVTCIGILGKVGQSATSLATNQQINSIIPNNKLYPAYGFWAAHLLKPQLDVIAGLQVVPIVNKNLFSQLLLACPSFSQQRSIAQILDTIDSKIQQTKQLIAKLKHIKAGLQQDLLTRGIDDNGNLRDPVAHPEEFKQVFDGKLKIPSEWKIYPLAKVAELSSGVTLGRDLKGANTVELPYLRVANVQDGYLDLKDVKTIRVQKEEVNRFLLQPGDVLMTEGGDFDKLGRGTVWTGEIPQCLHQNHIFKVRTNRYYLYPEFLALISGSSYGKQFFLLSSKQSTNLASINSTQLKAFPVPCPEKDEQERIINVINTQNMHIATEEANLNKLQQIKKGLMHDLLTGQVRVTHLIEEEEPSSV